MNQLGNLYAMMLQVLEKSLANFLNVTLQQFTHRFTDFYNIWTRNGQWFLNIQVVINIKKYQIFRQRWLWTVCDSLRYLHKSLFLPDAGAMMCQFHKKAEQEVVHRNHVKTPSDFQNKTNRVQTGLYLSWLQQQTDTMSGARSGGKRFRGFTAQARTRRGSLMNWEVQELLWENKPKWGGLQTLQV